MIAVVGGGAAGCFCAIEAARRGLDVCLLEAGPRLLAKVAVTGGGRCNLTNSFESVSRLDEVYPRGAQAVRRSFCNLSPEQTFKWFESKGVRLVAQPDGCIFPVSQDAMQIVRCLERELQLAGVRVMLSARVRAIRPAADGSFDIEIAGGRGLNAEKAVITTGGATRSALEAMLPGGVAIEEPVPSLFTLKIGSVPLRSLMGTVVENVCLKLAGTPYASRGTLLVTDWGVSGPATLKLSSYAARHLAQNAYRGSLVINWTGSPQEEVQQWVRRTAADEARRLVANARPLWVTDRLWRHLTRRAEARPDQRWSELGPRGAARIVQALTADCYDITGRARFKEEFVTCGGISLKEIDIRTLGLKRCPGLFAAGEVLDIDAVTGGFNLQAAWSTGYTAALGLCGSKH